MTFPFSKAFSLSALVVVSTMGVAIAQPAEAITVTRTNDPVYSNPVGYTTREIGFDNDASLPKTFTFDTDSVTITDSGTGSPSIGNGVLSLGNSATPSITFQFSDYLAYFGVRFANFGNTTATDTVITFFNGAENVGSFTRQTLTGLPFTVNANDNYFNFNKEIVSERFDKVVIGGSRVVLDDVAYRVPTPALLPGLVGIGVAALRKRKAEEEQEA